MAVKAVSLSVDVNGTTAVLDWNEPADSNPAYYEVRRLLNGVRTILGSPIANTPTSRTYTDSSGVAGETYDYRIRSYTAGIEALSNTVTVTLATGVTAAALPGPVLTATQGAGQVALVFTIDEGASVDNWQLQRATGAGAFADLATTGMGSGAHGAYSDATAVTGTSYRYRVRGTYDAAPDGTQTPWSNEVTISPTASVPVAPTLTGTAGDNECTLNWNSVANAATYRLSRSRSNGPYGNLVEIAGLTYIDDTVTNFVPYKYQVRGVTSGGVLGALSTPKALTPVPVTPPPPPPPGGNILGVNLAALPKSGTAYSRVSTLSNGSANLNYGDINGPGNDVLVAKAIMGKKAEVLAAVRAAKGSANAGANSLGVSRNLAATAIALSLCGAHEEDAWLKTARDMTYANQGALLEAALKANNHGSAADQSLVAIDLHINDRTHLNAQVIPIVKQRFGQAMGLPFRFGDLSFQADPSKPVVIGLPGSSKQGFSLDGCLAEEQRRQGSFPAFNAGNYNFGAAGQLLLTAFMLEKAGFGAAAWTSSAPKRVYLFFAAHGWTTSGDDRWQGHMVKALYSATIVPLAVGDGKTMGCTDYLFA